MGTTLTGKNISASYLGLLKTTDNAVIGSTAKRLTDGNGTDSPLFLSTSQLGIGVTPTEALTISSGNIQLSNDNKLQFGTSDVFIKGTTATDNIQIGLQGATKLTLHQTNGLTLAQYGSGSITGTVTQRLGVTSSGQVVEIPIGSGAVDGSGTAGKITKWSDSDTITDSIMTETTGLISVAGNVTLSSTAPLLHLANTTSSTGKTWRLSSASNGKFFITQEGVIDAITLDHTSGNATLVGDVTIQNSSPQITLLDTTNNTDALIYSDDNGSINISADENNEQGNSAIKLFTDGGEKARLDSTGLGIGTTSPSFKLDVDGSVALNVMPAHQSEGSIHIGRYDGNATRYHLIKNYVSSNQASNYMRFTLHNGTENATTDVMSLFGNNTVGIGTTSPSASLEVSKGSEGDYLIIGGDNSSNSRGLKFTSSTATSNGALHTIDAQSSNGVIALATGGSERMRINSDGNVGIGETSPSTKIHVVGSGSVASFGDGARAFRIFTDSDEVSLLADGSVDMKFYTSGAEKMRLDSDGRLAIGTTTAATGYQLTLSGSSTAGLVLNDTGQSGNYQIAANGTTSYWRFDGDNAKSISLNSTGLVGIGVINASSKLHIIDTSNPDTTSGSLIIEGRRDGGANVLTLRAKDDSNPSDALPNGQGAVMRFQGFDGTDFENMGYIFTGADGQAVANGDAPSFMAFGTSADGSSSPSERIRITSEGKLGVGTSAPTGRLSIHQAQISTQFDRDCFIRLHPTSTIDTTGYTNIFFGTSTTNNYGVAIGGEREGTGDGEPTFVIRMLDDAITGTEVFNLNNAGKLKLSTYGSGTHTGTATKFLAVDSSGNIIEEATSTIDGSGTAGKIVKWSDADTIGDSAITQSGDNIGIGTSPSSLLHIFSSAPVFRIQDGGTWGTNATGSMQFYESSDLMGEVSIASAGDMNLNMVKQGNMKFLTNNTERLRINHSNAELQIGGTTDAGFIDFNGTSLQLNTQRNPNTGTFVNTSKSQAGITLTGADADSKILFFTTSSNNTVATQRMIIDKSGQVGIGTSTPSQLLDVNGGAEFNGETYIRAQSNVGLRIQTIDQGITSNDGLRVGLNGTHAFVWNIENKDLAFATNNTERLTIKSDGKFGIGTSSPDVKTHIFGGSDSQENVLLKVQSNGVANDSSLSTSILLANSTGLTSIHGAKISAIRTGSATDDLTFSVYSTTMQERMRLDSDGRLGLGTTDPTSSVHVHASSSGSNYIKFTNDTTGATSTDGLVVGISGSEEAFFLQQENTAMKFATNDTTRMTIANDGLIGIGTTAPQSELHIDIDSGTNYPELLVKYSDNNDSTDPTASLILSPGAFSSNLSAPRIIGYRTANFQSAAARSAGLIFGVGQNNVAKEAIRITEAQDVGIGCTSIDEKLQVEEGNIKIEGGANSSTRGLIIAHSGQTGNTTSLVQNSSSSYGHLFTTDRNLRIEAGSNGSTGASETLDFLVNGSERATINTSGKVGINTTTPNGSGTKLQVQSSTHSQIAAHFGQGQDNADTRWGGISLGYSEDANSNYRKVALIAEARGDGAARQNLHFSVDTANNDGSAGLEDSKMMIDGLTGRVGIGKDNVTFHLEVESLDGNVALFEGTRDFGLKLVETSVDSGLSQMQIIGHNAASSYNALHLRSAVGTGLVIDTSNNVIIGGNAYGDNGAVSIGSNVDDGAGQIVFDRATTLAISLAIDFQNAGTSSGSITYNSTTTAYATSSDYRMKEDYKDFNALEIASKIKMYDFKWKDEDKRSYGVKAHELQEILPDAVTGEKDAEEMQGVDYSKLVPILLKSIQELKAEVDELKKNK